MRMWWLPLLTHTGHTAMFVPSQRYAAASAFHLRADGCLECSPSWTHPQIVLPFQKGFPHQAWVSVVIPVWVCVWVWVCDSHAVSMCVHIQCLQPPLSHLQVWPTTPCSARCGPCTRDSWTCGHAPARAPTTTTFGCSSSLMWRGCAPLHALWTRPSASFSCTLGWRGPGAGRGGSSREKAAWKHSIGSLPCTARRVEGRCCMP